MNLRVTLLCLLHCLLPGLGESFYNYIVPYESEVTITCPIHQEAPFEPNIYWFLPSEELITYNYSDHTFQMSDYPTTNLTIQLTSLETFGVYYCLVVHKNQTLDKAAVGVNVGVTLWHIKYRSKVTVGMIAAACLIVLMVSFCLISEFRYKVLPPATVLKLDDPRLHETYANCSFSLTDECGDSPAAEEKTSTDLKLDDLRPYETHDNHSFSITDESVNIAAAEEKTIENSNIEQSRNLQPNGL